jgi:hypothetical protein
MADGCPNCGSPVYPLEGMDAITCTNEDCSRYEMGWRPEEVRE